MVNNYKYPGITIDRRLTFTCHVPETKCKVDSRFNMIKTFTHLKIGVNTKMLNTLCKSLIQLVIVYVVPILLLVCDSSALQSSERIQRIPLRYILDLPNEVSPILVYAESEMVLIRHLIKKETATYLLRTATKPIQTYKKIQEPI